MALSDIFGALRRHTIALLIGLALTAALATGAYLLTKPTYETTGTLLLLPPPASVEPTSNPYLNLGGLGPTVDLLGVAMTDQDTQLELRGLSPDVVYTAKADPATSSPILLISVLDSSPESATRIRDLLMTRAPQRLAAMQARLNIDAKSRVPTAVLTKDSEPVEVGRDRVRAAVAAGALGLVLTLVFIAAWDARGRRRAALASPPAPVDTPASAPATSAAPHRTGSRTKRRRAGARTDPGSPSP